MFTIIMLIMLITQTGVVTVWWGWIVSIGCDLTNLVIGCLVGWYQHRKYIEKRKEELPDEE